MEPSSPTPKTGPAWTNITPDEYGYEYINCIFSRVFHKMLYQPPSPQRKKEVVPKETTKLRRPTFLKRSSEPLLNVKNANTQVRLPNNHIKILSWFRDDSNHLSRFTKMICSLTEFNSISIDRFNVFVNLVWIDESSFREIRNGQDLRQLYGV